MTYKILIIDDHPETLGIIQNVLETNGYNVVSARSGFRGVSLAETELPDLIMVDGMMPEMDGWEVCRRVRKIEELAGTPIIMFSAVEESEQKLAGFDAGADDYLTKPTEPDELIERVQALLQAVTPRHTGSVMASSGGRAKKDPLMTTQQVSLREPAGVAFTSSLMSDQSSLIVVLGARGGVGTTTLSINLAASLAEMNVPTTLVDLDFVQGHIALYLKQKVRRSINKLATLSTSRLKSQVSEAAVNYRDNLQLLLTRSNLLDERATLSVNQTMDMIGALSRPGHVVVVDLGRGITAVTRPIVEQADQVIICLRPERVSLAAAKQLVAKWKDVLLPHTSLNAVIFDFNTAREIPKQAIESYLGQSIMAVVPIQPSDFTKTVNKGVPFIELFKDSRTALIFKRVAHQMVKK
ncbi:MAG: response regulator [Chloroflexi bacterium]|nr:response regulator [Chloroflexota bacterium]